MNVQLHRMALFRRVAATTPVLPWYYPATALVARPAVQSNSRQEPYLHRSKSNHKLSLSTNIMAKLTKGILGPIRGKLGPVVGSSWKGIAYLREHNKTKAIKAHKTPAQLANQQKFKFIQQWLVPFHPYITVGFLKLAIRKTEINAAFSANFQAFTGIYPNIEIDYSRLIISKGDLPGLRQPEMELTASDTLEVRWLQNILYTASFDDQLMLALYSPELKITDGFIGGVKRSALQYNFQFDQRLVGKELEVYLSVTSSDRKKIADSIYMGRVLP